MKKSLIALAALAAVSAASAQSSVTMYGLVDIGYGTHNITSRDGSVVTKTTGLMDSVFGGPRIGFRGTEDLGGGLKANFVIESGISATTPTLLSSRTTGAGVQIAGTAGGFGTATNRQSYLGLSSNSMGEVRIGYQYTTAYELSTLSGYMVGNEAIGGLAHTAGLGVVGGSRANGVTYISPNFGGGFKIMAQYGATTGNDMVQTTVVGAGNGLTNDTNRRMGLMAQYANGPLSAAVAYTSLRSNQANGAAGVLVQGAQTNIFGGVAAPVGTVALTGVDRTANLTQLGASYDFGVAKLAGTYNLGKDGGTATSLISSRQRGYQVGVIVPFGAFAPYIMLGKQNVKADNAVTDTNDIRTVQLGMRYSLSKRTMAYAMYGTTVDNAQVGAAAAYKNTKTVVGVQHSF